MEEELRFNCSDLWQMCVDDDVTLTEAKDIGPGILLQATAPEGDNVAVAFDLNEHLLLIKNVKSLGARAAWFVRIAPGITHAKAGTSGSNRILSCDQDSGITAIAVDKPAATTVFIVSKKPFTGETAGLAFSPLVDPPIGTKK
jgi:hypothetical protein